MDITKENFKEQLPNIVEDLKRCCYIGFDAEFTAIIPECIFQNSLFDTNEERYDKIRNKIENMMISQIGLTFFQYNRDLNSYHAVGYTFHLSPQALGHFIDQSFLLQGSTLKFLCQHNFDFNKFIYKGLPYLSRSEETNLRKHIKDNTLLCNLIEVLEPSEDRQINVYMSEVSKWFSGSDSGTMYIDVKIPHLRYILHFKIRRRYPEVLTTDSLGNSNKMLIYRNSSVEGANSLPESTLNETFMNSLLGFSQIVYLLEQYQKPLVAHNTFLDILLLHNQFIGPLPMKYSVFKKNVHTIFPNIYDTKFISNEMSFKLSRDEVWKSNTLPNLYEFFVEQKCMKLEKSVNDITLSSGLKEKQSYHVAGWDSFCAGYCFFRMAHWAACETRGRAFFASPAEQIGALEHMRNKINVIRATIHYMNLEDNDPASHRPSVLHIKTLKDRVINVGQVISELAGYGAIDVKRYGTKTALIAAGSQIAVDRIMNKFKNNGEYRISVFNVYRHSVAGRIAMWSGAVLTGSLVLYFIHNRSK